MIARIRNPLLRKAIVVLTVAALVAALSAAWLIEALWARIVEDFGEDIAAAWNGPRGR
jgi:hypothetical protein